MPEALLVRVSGYIGFCFEEAGEELSQGCEPLRTLSVGVGLCAQLVVDLSYSS